ncbi:MAG: GGDEF domain-containing protein [Steroidobacteraceae bacterium]
MASLNADLNKKGLLQRLLLGNLASAPERVRARMLESVPTTTLSLVFYSTTLLVICATTVYISRATWAWAWLVASIVLIAWRAIHPVLERRKGRPQPLASIMISSGLAMASFGFGCAESIATGDIALTTMAMSGTMGVLAGLATRWAAVPRAAILTMLLSVLPPMVMLCMQGGAQVLAAVSMGLVVLSVAAFTLHNQEYLLAAVTAEELHRRMAQTDHLTGLANRAELLHQMAAACASLPHADGGRGRAFAVLYIDLDGFKAINDSHGHAAGDEVLQRVADCLRQATGPEELVARIGGDEFIVLLSDGDSLTARAVADEIIAAVSREHRIADGRVLRVGCSIGVCIAPDQGREPEVLLARADSALYEVKSQGKGHAGVWRAMGGA